MGTRALIRINDMVGGEEQTLVCIYKQHDGYLSGLGASLHEFLARKKMTNGIGSGADAATASNGVGDLAAQLIQELKEKHPLGGVYIYPPGTPNIGQDFTYTVNFCPNDQGLDELHSIHIDSLGDTILSHEGATALDKFKELIESEGE